MAPRHLHRPSEAVYRFCGPVYRCAYCGDPADTIDHTVPRWFVAGNHELIKRFAFVKVQSCQSCNCLAGSVVDATMSARKKRIEMALFKKFSNVLQTADWEEDEIKALGRGLRKYIKSAQVLAEAVRTRLLYLRNPMWPVGVPDDLMLSIDQAISATYDNVEMSDVT